MQRSTNKVKSYFKVTFLFPSPLSLFKFPFVESPPSCFVNLLFSERNVMFKPGCH